MSRCVQGAQAPLVVEPGLVVGELVGQDAGDGLAAILRVHWW